MIGCWLVGLVAATGQQYFNFNDTGDVLVGFRKTGAFQGNYELVVDIGNVVQFLTVPAGGSLNISNYTITQLSDAFPDDFANLQWSCFASFADPSNPWTNAVGVYPVATTWYTIARTNNVQTKAPARMLSGASGNLRQFILSVGYGAYQIAANLGTTNNDNNTLLVREPISFSANILTAYIGDPGNPALGDFHHFLQYSVENTTPDPFTTLARSDFYQSVPLHTVDPITGLSTGTNYYVGNFTLNTDGTMTFTRAGGAVILPPPPPPKFVSLSVSGGNVSVFFTTTNNATYTLYYTNAAGLTSPVTNWASVPMTVTGNGLTNSIMDTTTDANRFYRIGVHQ